MTEDADDLDALIRRTDPDRWLSSRFVTDPAARADLMVLYAYDHELARAPRVASEPLMGEIRLTWWREALDEIFEKRTVRRQPTALALAKVVARHGLPREPLEAMIDGRYRELDREPMSPDEAIAWAAATAGETAALAARLLDPVQDSGAIRAAGQAWALARLERDGSGLQLTGAVAQALREARSAPVSPAAFPAVAHASLARAYARSRELSEFGKRLRLVLAVARGKV